MPITTAFERGAVVLLPFPFSDQTASKVRPAIVCNPAHASNDLLVVAVSSVAGTLRAGEFSLQFWREAGLIHPSFVKRAIASVSAGLVRKQLGQVHPDDVEALNTALRFWFGL